MIFIEFVIVFRGIRFGFVDSRGPREVYGKSCAV